MIVLLRDRKLARRLRNNEVSKRDVFHHFIATSLLWTLSVCSFTHSGRINTSYDYFFDAIMLGMAVALPLILFHINNKGDGEFFLERYVTLSVPIAIQALLIFGPLFIVAMFYDNRFEILPYMKHTVDMTPEEMEDVPTPLLLTGTVSLGISIAIYVYMGWRYCADFKIAAGLKDQQNV